MYWIGKCGGLKNKSSQNKNAQQNRVWGSGAPSLLGGKELVTAFLELHCVLIQDK